MEFTPRKVWVYPGNLSIPYYMTHSGYLGPNGEQEMLADMEYLQQAYPSAVRQYQMRVAQILDKMDYEGSMIYDEYPDVNSLRRMVESIVRILQNESEELPDEQHLKDMIQVLLCNEVYKRRHGGRRGSNFWTN